MSFEKITKWLKENLFSSFYNGIFTILLGSMIILSLWFGGRWLLFVADWSVISVLGGTLIIGQYNTEIACSGGNCFWRPAAALLISTFFFGFIWGSTRDSLAKKIAIIFSVASAAFAFLPYTLERMGFDIRILLILNLPALIFGYYFASYFKIRKAKGILLTGVLCFLAILLLLHGVSGVKFLEPVSVIYWGGLMLNLLLAVSGIVLCLPIGILLALGRRSSLHLVKVICILFIELFRGVPLIALLFMSQTLVPLAFPEDFPLNSLYRAAIIITLFSSAYMAENIRGGLQALSPGQQEAARALGLSGVQTTLLISLPQALKNVIPAIVGQFISLFKDTNLVYIIGMLDMVGIGRAFISGNPVYLNSSYELFIFLAVTFWIFAYGLSHVSRYIERKTNTGVRNAAIH